MISHSLQRLFATEQIGDITIVRFPSLCELAGEIVPRLGEQLFDLIDHGKHTQLLMNLHNVSGIDSAMIGKVVGLHRRALAAGGRLALCQIPAELNEILQTVKLGSVMGFYRDEEEALRTF